MPPKNPNAGRKPKTLTPKNLNTIQQIYAKGGTDKEAYNAIGWSMKAFYDHTKTFKTPNGETWQEFKEECKTELCTSIRTKMFELAMGWQDQPPSEKMLIHLAKQHLKENTQDPLILELRAKEYALKVAESKRKERELKLKEAAAQDLVENAETLGETYNALKEFLTNAEQ